MELPANFSCGQLSCYTSPGAIRPSRFAWLAGPGLYRGNLSLNVTERPPSELDYLTEHNLLPLPLSAEVQGNAIAVVSDSSNGAMPLKAKWNLQVSGENLWPQLFARHQGPYLI